MDLQAYLQKQSSLITFLPYCTDKGTQRIWIMHANHARQPNS